MADNMGREVLNEKENDHAHRNLSDFDSFLAFRMCHRPYGPVPTDDEQHGRQTGDDAANDGWQDALLLSVCHKLNVIETF